MALLVGLIAIAAPLHAQGASLKRQLLYECHVAAPAGMTADCLHPELESAGDFNGDGHDDLLVTLWRRDCQPGSWLGECWNAEVEVRSGLDGSPLWHWPDPSNHACALAAARAGDINRDGREDLILTVVSSVEETRPRVGIVAGPDGQVIRAFEADFESDLIYGFDGLPRCFGSEVGSVGDVDSDFVPDYYVGSPEQSTPLLAEGNAGHPDILGRGFIKMPGNGIIDVYSGRTGKRIWRQTGINFEHGFAYSATAIGDVDGDDAPDLVVGAPPSCFMQVNGTVDAGCIYTLSGRDGEVLNYRVGRSQTDGLGRTIVPLGDLDRDGSTEVAVGAWNTNGLAQETVIIRLSDGEVLRTLDRWRLGAIGCQGVIRGAGDMDGDGRIELVEFVDPPRPHRLPIRGRPEVHVVDPRSGESLVVFQGEWGRYFGCAAGSAGDADGDGRGDLAVCEGLVDEGDTAVALIRVYTFDG